MNETANQELGQAPVGKLMARFAIPCIMSLLVSALYNIVAKFLWAGVWGIWATAPPMWSSL